jgi:transcriptional regulator with XRE-family HTH domain
MSGVIPKLLTFAERLRWARELRGFGVKQLAEQLGYARQTVGRLENGTYPPSIEQIETLAKLLDVDAVWLAFGRGMPFALPTVEAYLESAKGKLVSPEAAAWLRDRSYRLFDTLTPSDGEIEVALVLIAHLLKVASQRGDGDGSE